MSSGTQYHNGDRAGEGNQSPGDQDSGGRGILRQGGSSGNKHAHFASGGQDRGDNYHLPTHVYDRYMDEMDGQTRGQGHGHTQETSVDVEQMGTMYIPKGSLGNGTKTLMRRRRASSKRRSSSRRRERENLDDLLSEEDNHLLPSLRFQRRTMLKSMKDRRNDLEYEKSHSFKSKYQDLKDRDALNAENLAGIVRDSSLRRGWFGEWSRPNRRDRFSRWSHEFFSHFRIWDTSFKVIEGKFGTAVMSFFKFIRWLMLLNIFIMIIMFCVITVPFLALHTKDFEETVNVSDSNFHYQAVNCSNQYYSYSKEILRNESDFEKVLDFLQGTGWMERTILFYGHYHNRTYMDGEEDEHVYNMGLAYILAIGACFVFSFLLLVRNSAKSVKATFGMQSSVAAFSNRIFGGWDFAISNVKAAKIKKRNLFVELKDTLAEDTLRRKIAQRSRNDKATLFFKRFMVNGFVLIILAGALFLVYYTTDKLLVLQQRELETIVALIVQYLPYLTITVLNFVIPLIFQKIVLIEEYSHNTALRVTLLRSILLRLASLGVLIGSLYRLLIVDADINSNNCGNRRWRQDTISRGSIKCWETYVGQQIYKLVLLDLVVETTIIVFMQLPRRLLYDRYHESVSLIKKVGPQAFDLPQNVIDIIYTQTLCWLGLFFSPLIPFITFTKCILFFYLRKWTLLKNCSQEEQVYRSSRSQSLFMFVLLLSFILATVPVGYMISSISPSQSCGPFRIYTNEEWTMFDTLSLTIGTWPGVLREIVLFLGTIGFLLPVIIILLLLIYLFWLIGNGYKRREKLLSNQLKLEAKDKQFLLARVNEVLAGAEG